MALILSSITKLTILSEAESEIYYICQPSNSQQRILPSQQKQTNLPNLALSKQVNAPMTNGSKWSTDDH